MPKILIVEDDPQICELVKDWLIGERHTVETTSSGKDADHLLVGFAYDLVILDWQLPDLNGVDVLKAYRNRGGQTKVILLTSKSLLEDKEFGLDCGADDYMTKPFECRELSARIRALLRRPKEMHGPLLRCGSLELDSQKAKVFCKGTELELLPKEYSLLEYLMRHENQIFSAETLLSNVWKSDVEATDMAVRTTVSRLRKKLMSLHAGASIVAIYGLGYRLQEENEEFRGLE